MQKAVQLPYFSVFFFSFLALILDELLIFFNIALSLLPRKYSW